MQENQNNDNSINSENFDEQQAYSQQEINWQPILERINWEELNNLIDNYSNRSTKEKLYNLIGMYVLVAITILTAGYLALEGIIQGQAIAGFLGAAIGYLISRANFNS